MDDGWVGGWVGGGREEVGGGVSRVSSSFVQKNKNKGSHLYALAGAGRGGQCEAAYHPPRVVPGVTLFLERSTADELLKAETPRRERQNFSDLDTANISTPPVKQLDTYLPLV